MLTIFIVRHAPLHIPIAASVFATRWRTLWFRPVLDICVSRLRLWTAKRGAISRLRMTCARGGSGSIVELSLIGLIRSHADANTTTAGWLRWRGLMTASGAFRSARLDCFDLFTFIWLLFSSQKLPSTAWLKVTPGVVGSSLSGSKRIGLVIVNFRFSLFISRCFKLSWCFFCVFSHRIRPLLISQLMFNSTLIKNRLKAGSLSISHWRRSSSSKCPGTMTPGEAWSNSLPRMYLWLV